jgi:pyruvate,water dikinase
MDYVLSLNSVYGSDVDKIGYRAIDLAKLFNKKFIIPLSFIVSNDALKDFLESNALKAKIARLCADKDPACLEKNFGLIKELFSKAELSEDFKKDLLEAYETLAVDPDSADAGELLEAAGDAIVNLIVSPSYLSDDAVGILMNVRGKDALLEAVKSCWLALFSPEAVLYRHENSISDGFGVGIIVQKLVDATASASSFTRDKGNDVLVRSYNGLADFVGVVTADEHLLSEEYLKIKSGKVKHQEFKLVRGGESGTLSKRFLKEKGIEQKITEKEIMEIARLTKRAKFSLEKDVKVFFSVKRNKIFLLFCNRIVAESVKESVEPKVEEMPLEEEKQLKDDLEFLDKIEAEEHPVKTEEPSVEIFDDSPIEVVDEEKPEIVDEKPEEKLIFPEDDDSIFSSFKDEPSEATVSTEDPSELLGDVAKSAGEIVLGAEKAIIAALKQKYFDIFGEASEDVSLIVSRLKERMSIPYEADIEQVLSLKSKVEDGGQPTVEELMLCLEVAKRFSEGF